MAQKNQQISIFIFIHGMFHTTKDKDSELWGESIALYLALEAKNGWHLQF